MIPTLRLMCFSKLFFQCMIATTMDDSYYFHHPLLHHVRYPRFVRSDLTVYWIAVFLRFLLTLLPQSGYIHPDEFFQSTEVVIGKNILFRQTHTINLICTC